MSPAKLAELAAKFPEVAKQFNSKGPIYEDALLRAEKASLPAAVVPEPVATPVQEPVMPAVIEGPIVLAAPVEAPATTPAPLTAVDPRFATPLAGALTLAAMGIPQIPVSKGLKKTFLKDWPNLATTDAARIERWAEENPDCNFASVAKSEIGGFWFLELDEKDLAKRIAGEAGQPLPNTLLVRSRQGRGHLYFRQNVASITMGNITQPQVKGAGFSVRVNNEYVVCPGSYRLDLNRFYEPVVITDIVEAPQWLINWIQAQRIPAEKAADVQRDENNLIPHGQIHDCLVREAGSLRNRGYSLESLENALVDWAHDNCAPPLDEEKIRQVARSAKNWKQGDPRPEILFGGSVTQQRTGGTATEKTTDCGLVFKYSAVTDIEDKERDRDYVIAPLTGQKDGWFPRGITSVVGGPSGGSKSTLMNDLLQAQKDGEPYLGHATYGLPYLIVMADRGKRASRRTIDRMNLNEKSIPTCAIPVVWDGAAVQMILDKIENCDPLPSVIFVEGMDMMVSEPHKMEKVSPFLDAMNKIAEHYHIAIIGSVGSPKAKRGEGYAGGRDKIFGSVSWSRMTETIAMLQYVDGDDADARRSLVILLRNGPAEKFELKMGSNGRLEQVRPEAKSTVKKHLVWMEVQGDWWTVNDLAAAVQISVPTAYRYVEDAHAKRLIRSKQKASKFARLYLWNTPADLEQIEKSEKEAEKFAAAKAELERAGILEKQEARAAARKQEDEDYERKQTAARAKKYRRGKKASAAKPGEQEIGPTEP